MPVVYRLDADARAIATAFGARAGDDPWQGGAVTPGRFAPVVTAGREFAAGPRPPGGPAPARLVPRLWGVPPPPSVPDSGRGVTTVRNPDSPFWIGNLRNSEFRCLIPATGFMIWAAGNDADRRRTRCWYAPADQPVFAFAGVWKDSEVPSFAILTCAPNALLRQAGRAAMPVILAPGPAVRHVWLNAGWDRAAALLQPYPSGVMRAVSPLTPSGREDP